MAVEVPSPERIDLLIAIVNVVGLFLFLILLGATMYGMVRRLRLYRQGNLPLPVLLKRGFVLFGALTILGGEVAVLRGLSIMLEGLPRLVYLTQYYCILLGAMAYYAKVELIDIDDEDVP